MITQRDTTIVEMYNIEDYQEQPLKEFLEGWFKENGRGVTHGSYTTQNRRMEEVQSYWYIQNKIEGLALSDILEWQLVSMRPGASADIMASFNKPQRTLEIIFIHPRTWFDSRDLLKLLNPLLDHISPTYGVAYSLKEKGEGRRIEDDASLERTDAWEDYYDSPGFKKSAIKDIYSFNILNQEHLERKIEGIPLNQWIKGDDKRGSLVCLQKDLTLWEIRRPSSLKKDLRGFINEGWLND